MKKHWAVLIQVGHLTRTDARYHEWFAPGVTACNRSFYLVGTMRNSTRDHRYAWVNRKNAERFAEPCKRCAAVLSATEGMAASG